MHYITFQFICKFPSTNHVYNTKSLLVLVFLFLGLAGISLIKHTWNIWHRRKCRNLLEHVQWGPTHASSLNVPDGAWLGSHHKREIVILVLRYTWGKALCTDFIALLETVLALAKMGEYHLRPKTVAIRHRMWPTGDQPSQISGRSRTSLQKKL